MKCPHCTTTIVDAFNETLFANLGDVQSRTGQHLANAVQWKASWQRCANCHNLIIYLGHTEHLPAPSAGLQRASINHEAFLAHPRNPTRPIPSDVPSPYRDDFAEACLVFGDSPKASAALSRRCLQSILRDKAGTKKKDLFDQIDEVRESGKLPSHIEEGLDAVRNIGNFAAHPMKSTVTGAILDVEPGEAEWNLDVVEALFDYYFVQPAIHAKRKAALNPKLKEAGKPEIP